MTTPAKSRCHWLAMPSGRVCSFAFPRIERGTGFNIRDYAGPATARCGRAELNLFGLFLSVARLAVSRLPHAFQGSASGTAYLLQTFLCALVHGPTMNRS